MGREAAPRLAGDHYQHLIAWYYLLELLLDGRQLASVTVEDAEAGSADDVTLRHAGGSPRPDTFLQVKYHVHQRGEYSAEALVATAGRRRSLLQKLHATWRRLTADSRQVEIHLVSNWTWKSGDPLPQCTEGDDGALSEELFTKSPRSRAGRARERWRQHLGVEPDELTAFARTLRFRLGLATIRDLETWIADRMRLAGLRDDPAALLIAAGLVRQLVREGRRDLTRPDVERLVDRHGLRLPAGEEPAVTVYLITIQARRYDLPPDHLLDWRHHFAGGGHRKGHAVVDPAAWNEKMLPELLDLERRIATTTPVRLIRARGQARLSPWILALSIILLGKDLSGTEGLRRSCALRRRRATTPSERT